MKKIVLIAAAALLSLAASAQDVAPAQGLKIAYVDFTELVQLMPEADEARKNTEAASVEAQEAYQTMIDEYQMKAQQYEQKNTTWSATVRESKEKELQQLVTRIQEFEQDIQRDLQVLQNQLQTPIYEKAQNVVNQLAKEKGIAMVMEKNSLLYLDPAQLIDLTPEARKALNIPEGRTLEQLQQELQAKAQAAQGM